jgi:hypothetical protein
MRKILTLIMLLALAIPTWAGEKTITISRNDVDWENANTVYNISKGGVQLVMPGGMNNPNFLLMKQQETMTIKSANFNIKKIVFHCLDNTDVNAGDETFYNGPQTMNVMYNQTHKEIAGTYSSPYLNNTYDGCWVSTKSSSPGNYPDGLPAGYELMFENGPRPIRFASIDIVVEQEVGDIYELVTSNDEVVAGKNYILVNRKTATDTEGRAFSVNQYNNSTSGNFLSTPVELLENGRLVKATGDVLIMKLETSDNTNYPFCIKAVGGYLRTETQAYSTDPESYRISRTTSKPSNSAYVNTKININTTDIQTNWGYFAQIGFQQWGFNKRIFHYNSYNQFRTFNTSWAETQNRVYLYQPSKKLLVTTEVKPEETQGSTPYGTISLRDGILVEVDKNWSQKMDTVQFLVTPKNGYKIKNVTIQQVERDEDNDYAITEVKGNVDALSISPSINGTLYTFIMPEFGAHIIAEFEEVTYRNIYTVVKPSSLCGNIFLTEGYVVQQDQVKSYDGENVVFNVTSNPIDITAQNPTYYELSYVTWKIGENGEETIIAPDANGNYSFTMPDAEVTITAYFYDNVTTPLYLIGTANGGEWHPYGPRFNYDDETDEYYIDVYFKGTGDYGSNTGNNWGEFRVTWKANAIGDEDWSKIQNDSKQGHPWATSIDPLTNQHVYENGGVYRLADGQEYGLDYAYGWYNYGYNQSSNQEDYKFTIDPGIYRIYVGTQASQDKGRLGKNVLTAVKRDISLTLTPMGGETAEVAVEVPQHQLVAMSGDLNSKIKAINPNEADGNFMYKATISGVTDPQTESAGASTTGIATLDVVNDGETVTTLNGTNYLGWIHADKTAFYKVINTPLKWIERDGEVGKIYTVSDQLLGVWAHDGSLWCKDLGNISNVKTEPGEGQVDYLATTLKPIDNDSFGPMRLSDWDQSNWVELDFTGLDDAATLANAGMGQLIAAGSVTGDYVDDLNYRIKLDKNITLEGAQDYVPNTYSPVNFLESNLTASGVTVGDNNYYFLNPKIQEYAVVTFAVWDSDPDKQIFVVRDGLGFDGAFRLGTWQYNIDPDGTRIIGDLNADQNADNLYRFHMLVQRDSKDYGTPTKGIGKANQTASTVIKVQPIDLNVDSKLPTAISGVMSSAQVTGVEYVNLAGMRNSKPFEGVNIVVTRYSDGSSTTSKMVR